jgi:hypothetical protein
MLLVISGEGNTDVGAMDEQGFKPGPMTCVVDQLLKAKTRYSLLETDSVRAVHKKSLEKKAKELKIVTKRGKKTSQETRYFYKNARAMARMAQDYSNKEGRSAMAVLFRDADTAASGGRGEWIDKFNSMLAGFKDENFDTGVPMLPKPTSEAWILCALRNKYQQCEGLEQVSASRNSPKFLKKQLKEFLGVDVTRVLLVEKIETGQIEAAQIDMPSMEAFKHRCYEALKNMPKI